MTKAEQARLTAWRLKVLRQAADERECRADVPAFRDFPEGVLQVETAARRARGGRPVRPAADAAPIAASHAARGGQQDPVPAAALSLRAGPDRRLPEALSSGIAIAGSSVHRILERARHESAAGESEAPAARQALAALREAAAGAPPADGREVPRAHPGHRDAALSVHRHRRLHADSRAQGLRRVQPAHGDPVHRRGPAAPAVSRPRRADRQRRRVPVAVPLAPRERWTSGTSTSARGRRT